MGRSMSDDRLPKIVFYSELQYGQWFHGWQKKRFKDTYFECLTLSVCNHQRHLETIRYESHHMKKQRRRGKRKRPALQTQLEHALHTTKGCVILTDLQSNKV
ncbi:hypothetical protein DPMN_099678 [Dreissena polymorpha]|uniref:Uncharacterized protein n=1 Tax=Dreissena polymorpha TaxID=45954 RepID=A0A9D4LFY7_DREPO|nr:hypothetical protein DPMN_099678 [Dreissena polymorpha]